MSIATMRYKHATSHAIHATSNHSNRPVLGRLENVFFLETKQIILLQYCHERIQMDTAGGMGAFRGKHTNTSTEQKCVISFFVSVVMYEITVLNQHECILVISKKTYVYVVGISVS